MKSWLMVLMVLFFGQAGSAWATCRAGAVDARFGSAQISADAPVGTEVGNTTVTVTYTCDSATLTAGNKTNDVVFQLKPTGAFTAIDFVYPTGVAGIGVRLSEQSTGLFVVKPGRDRVSTAVNSFCWRRMSGGYDDEGCGKLPAGYCQLGSNGGQCSISFRASLVKLGAFTAGRLDSKYGNIEYYSPGVSGGSLLAEMRISGTVAVRASCTIRDMYVDLGKVGLNSLPGTGAIPAKQFDVTVTGCAPNQSITMSFSTLRQSGTVCQGLMSNGAGGTATGVGIKITHGDGTTLCWGETLSYPGRPDGIVKVPLRAAMTRLTSNPQPGTVVGTMTVQVSYL
ncbi:fimbrial protein [Herbaspirillum sp. YR522]|uniref:fimbrial protein n=1 Tax=Herbaspirillum sp. YR522 TaxID=1144342 RepID=UPI00026F91A8|nr:fimbrial protein [Herbaspirillum sp. YR522]EJM96062.1 P pilus assembly protein, pilin FimA [Herbaspirillum sp. YR522]